MNARQEAKLNMYRAVLQQSEENATLTASVPAFTSAMTAFKTTIAALLSTVQQQVQVTSGATVNKSEAKRALCEFTRDVAAAIYAFADTTGNPELKERSKTSFSALMRKKDDELSPVCRNVYDLAKDNAGELAGYGITDTLINSFKTVIDNYASAVPAPRNAVAQRIAYRKNLAALVKQADKILTQRLDKLVNNFKITDATYITAYQSNRSILDPGKTVTQLKATVTSTEGKIVPGAEMQIVEKNLALKSNGKGLFTVSPITPGAYTFVITAPGYETQTLPETKMIMGRVNTFVVMLKSKA